MRTASASALIRRPRAEVFAFHADAANLSRVAPFIRVEGDGRLGRDRVVRMAAGVGPLVLRTLLCVQEFDPPWSFTDAYRAGPFSMWTHSHRFAAVGPFTVVHDTVRFRLIAPLRPFEPMCEGLIRAFLRAKLARTALVLERPAAAAA